MAASILSFDVATVITLLTGALTRLTPALGAVAAGRNPAGPGECAVERVLGGIAEGSGDGADGVIGVSETHGGKVHAPASQVGGRGVAHLDGEAAGQRGAGDAHRSAQGGEGPVAAGLGVRDGPGGAR